MRIVILLLFISPLCGCAANDVAESPAESTISRNLPVADLTLHIAGLMSCSDKLDHSLHLKANQPVYVLVHGCFGSSGQFRGLAQVLAFHGQQTVCFTYDDRARLGRSAMDLRSAIDLLAAQTGARQITVIGHSQGALIAYRSLTYVAPASPGEHADFHLVTISGPFNGIGAARTCGRQWLYPFTLGLLPLSCYAVTGAKWLDITYSSRFIRNAGVLAPQVTHFLKIDTDESGTCRSEVRGRCVEGDEVFSLAEQRNMAVEADIRARRVQVAAGHVEIVGDKHVAPAKLIAILQEQDAIPMTAPERLVAFNRLIAHLYQGE